MTKQALQKELLEKVRENLTSEKQQHKGSLERIKLLTEQISKLEKQLKKIPGEFQEENQKPSPTSYSLDKFIQ